MKRWGGTLVLTLALLFLLGPFAIIASAGVSGADVMEFPPTSLSARWFLAPFLSDSFRQAFLLSFELAVGATILALALGVPAAYALDRFKPRGGAAVKNLVMMPLMVPGIIVGLALLNYLVVPLDMPVGVALFLAHAALLVPYALRVVLAGLENLRTDIEEAAWLLGATPVQAFMRVVLPNIRSGILAAFVLGFITSFNQVPVSLFLIGPGINTLPIAMLNYVQYNYDPLIAALSTVLAVITIAIVVGMERALGLSRFV